MHRLTVALVLLLTMTACAGRIRPGAPAPGAPGRGRAGDRAGDRAGGSTYVATAYCQGTVTATGTRPNDRTIAADPDVIPLGSRIRVSGLDDRFKRYNRTYLVSDTGANIQGRRLDIYIRNCAEAREFGRRSVRVAVVR